MSLPLHSGLNREHMLWVQTVADRAACGLMALQGSALYSEEGCKAAKMESLAKMDQDKGEDIFEPASPADEGDAN